MHILPNDIDKAENNMAKDLLLLLDYPYPKSPRFRHYAWMESAYTFGYMQRYREILQCKGSDLTLVRRPSGGGIVKHCNDWTYALVIPQNHHLFHLPPQIIYQQLHMMLKTVLRTITKKKLRMEKNLSTDNTQALTCFDQASKHDIIDQEGNKIAGAALKKTKTALLVQGSILHPALTIHKNDLKFYHNLIQALSYWVEEKAQLVPKPHYDKKTRETRQNQFYSNSWNQKR